VLVSLLINDQAMSRVLVLSLSTNPLSHFHVEGNLTDIPMGRVEPNQSACVEVPIAFVAEGQFEFVAEVHVLGEEIRSGEGELKVIVREL
jgi:trafficking protein particle complex subunit 9